MALAAAVIVGHSFAITAQVDPTGGWLQRLPGDCVNGFFAISGFLIAASRFRTSVPGFLWRRALRIFPGLWVALTVIAFVYAPLSLLRAPGVYSLSQATSYVLRNSALKILQDGVGTTLSTVPQAYIWNGPQWTLVWEFAAYLALGLMLTMPATRRRAIPILAVAFVSLSAVNLAIARGLATGLPQEAVNGSRLGTYFVAGALLFFVRNRMQITWPMLGIAAAAHTAVYALEWELAVGQLSLAYVLLGIAVKVRLAWCQKTDLSYGMYIYGWPNQQLIYLFLPAETPWAVQTLLALITTAGCAWLSWTFIEKRALSFKRAVA